MGTGEKRTGEMAGQRAATGTIGSPLVGTTIGCQARAVLVVPTLEGHLVMEGPQQQGTLLEAEAQQM